MAGTKRKASAVVDAIEELHISPRSVPKTTTLGAKDSGLLVLVGEDHPKAAKPSLKKIDYPYEGPISLHRYAEIIEAEASAEAEYEDVDVDAEGDMDRDTVMSDDGDSSRSISDGRSVAQAT